MAIRLRVRELAERNGLKTIGRFQLAVGVSMSTARRMWYSTSDGREEGPNLKMVDLEVIERIADRFGVAPGELFKKE